ncbi:MAG: hypothetical protein N2Z65_03875 [Clostridiales bacterium]|nr:hypothetical protein [Clostridiales bacterium]
MQNEFAGLGQLIAQNEKAKRYYMSLPDYVRNQIATRADNVNTYSSLRDYAENLLRGDD